jgi:hypothetical protein
MGVGDFARRTAGMGEGTREVQLNLKHLNLQPGTRPVTVGDRVCAGMPRGDPGGRTAAVLGTCPGWRARGPAGPHPRRGDGMDDGAAVDAIAAMIREQLRDPATRAEVAALLTGSDDARQRRLDELAADLDAYELAWRRREGDQG